MKFFNIDLHISIIADMQKIFRDLGHVVDDISLSDHHWVFNKKKGSIPFLDDYKWKSISPQEYSDLFYKNYKNNLGEYDAFIVTYPPAFSLLYKHFDKPIIINNPIRYEWPFSFRSSDWNYFNDYIRDGVDSKKIYLVANNLYDKKYMEDFIERDVEFIPSICDYYGEYYNPNKDTFLYYSKGVVEEIKSNKIIHKDSIFSTHRHKDLTYYKGLVHFPYQVSYMSIFEQYTANIPLFVPTQDFLIELYKKGQKGILKEVSWNGYMGQISKSFIEYKKQYDPNNYLDIESMKHWIQFSDFYDETWMPHIVKFSSFHDLEKKTNEVDTSEISDKMNAHNKIRKESIYKMWANLIDKIR